MQNRKPFRNPLTQSSTSPSPETITFPSSAPSTVTETYPTPSTKTATETSTVPSTSLVPYTSTSTLAVARKRGDQRFEVTHSRVTWWLHNDLKARFEGLVEQLGVSKSAGLDEAISDWLQKYGW